MKMRLRKILTIILVLVILVSALTTPVGAYNLLGTYIDSADSLDMYLHTGYEQFPTGFVENLYKAINDWLKIDNRSDLISINTKDKKTYSFANKDGHNVICIESDRYNRYLGQAAVWFQNGKVIEADLNINPIHNWSIEAGDDSAMHFYSTVLHELGHILGLDHTDTVGSCMQPYLGPGETFKISESDEEGFKAIYSRNISSLETKEGFVSGEEGGIQYANFYLRPMFDLQELTDTSTLIVKGEITEISNKFTIQEANGIRTKDFVNLTVKVNEKIADQMDLKKDHLKLRIPYESLNLLDADGENLFFLIKPTTGGQYITRCDYYMVSFGNDSIFKMSDDGNKFSNNSGNFTKAELEKAIAGKTQSAYSYSNAKVNKNVTTQFYSENLISDIMDEDSDYGTILGERTEDTECIYPNNICSKQTEYTALEQDLKIKNKTKATFEKFFTNKIQAVNIKAYEKHENGIAVPLDNRLNFENLELYEYNIEKNSYKLIPKKNYEIIEGFLVFKDAEAMDYVISDGLLEKFSEYDMDE